MPITLDPREKLLQGISTIGEAVGATMGPGGRTVIIDSPNHTRGLTVTKDGVTVAKHVYSDDPVENLAIRIIREASENTADSSGDGPQPLYSKILTPSGWISMGEAKKGMTITGSDGKPQTIVDVFEKGEREIFKIETLDGRIVECCEDHLWTVISDNGHEKTIPLKLLIKKYKRTNVAGYVLSTRYIKKTGAVDFNERTHVLDPYLIGLLLGDGSLSGTGSVELSIGEKHKDIIDRIVIPEGLTLSIKYCPEKKYYRVKIKGKTVKDGKYARDLIEEMGLLGVRSDTKFIPEEYLHDSIENRKRLLKGLTDTDGYVNGRGLVEYSTISKQLKDDFIELNRSLGIDVQCRIKHRNGSSYSNTPIYVMNQLVGFKFGRKIKSIEPTGIISKMRCIKVSNPDSLYFTDDYVLTHNTSTSVVLARALVENGLPYCTGNQTVKINRAIRKYSELIIAELQKRSKKVSSKNLASVATISANGDASIGKIISDTYKAIGVNGAITIENSPSAETYAEVSTGVKFSRGLYNPLFVNNEFTGECILKDCYILLTDIEIPTLSQVEHLMKHAAAEKKPLLLVAPVAGAVISIFSANFRNGYKFVPVEPPSFGYKQTELMQDLALVTNGTFFSKSTGDNLEMVQPEHLGFASSVKISKDQTVIELAGNGDKELIDQRIKEISSKLNQKIKKKEKDFLRERLAFLNGKVATIFVGADSEVEQKEKLDRVDDAVCATRSALEEGILPGGGIALYNMHDLVYELVDENLEETEIFALDILSSAMLSPFDTIMKNAEIETPKHFEDTGKHFDIGIDATDGQIKNMYDAGIIDPFKVTKNALRNAVSVATTILTTAVTITK